VLGVGLSVDEQRHAAFVPARQAPVMALRVIDHGGQLPQVPP
jgi:hypothetical protein